MANQFLYLFLTKYESMKNILKHAVPAIWILFGTLWGQHAAAAIDAKISFETEIPKAFVCGENSTAELSASTTRTGAVRCAGRGARRRRSASTTSDS